MSVEITNEEVLEQINSNSDEAENLLKDEDKMERFLQRLESKLKNVPLVGDKLSNIPVLISLVRAYMKKEYQDIPIGTMIGIVSALIYFLSPIDLLPDSIPVLGYLDDAAVIAFAWKMAETDIEEYIKWRDENGKTIQ